MKQQIRQLVAGSVQRAIQAEALAEQMLRGKGYRILERNLRVAGGGIGSHRGRPRSLVFIEVKARRGNHFGGVPYAITTRKKQQIIKLALCYLSQRGLNNQHCRFDAVLVVETNQYFPQLTHIEQAFEVSSSDWQW